MSTNSIAGSAHAKINLGLEILRKRPDGYHDLATVFCPISLSDEITCTMDEAGLSLTVEGIQVPVDGSNLCIRAAELMRTLTQESVGARIHLRKHIPVGAGLGGGSSDAACVLRLLNDLWALGLSANRLRELAVTLGADVPYFVEGGFSSASGVGEVLKPLQRTFPYWILTVIPPEHVSTAWAYGQVVPRNTDVSQLHGAIDKAMQDLRMLEECITNDFEQVVLPAYPSIRETMQKLSAMGLSCVRMSGSGSAVFGLSASEEQARKAAGMFAPPCIVSLSPPVLS